MSDYYLELTSCCKSWPTYHSEEDLWLQEHGKSSKSVPAYALAARAGAAEDTGKQAAQCRREAMQSEKQQEKCQQQTWKQNTDMFVHAFPTSVSCPPFPRPPLLKLP